MRTRSLSLAAGALLAVIAGAGLWVLTRPSPPPERPSLTVELRSIVGEDLTEGEATAWNNAAKLAVGPRGDLHLVYQYAYGKRDAPDRIRYARSSDGREWEIVEERAGRYPTIAVDERGNVYIAYVERTAERDRLWLGSRTPSGTSRRVLVDEGPRRTRAYPALMRFREILLLAWETHEAGVHRIRFVRLPARPDGDGVGPPETVVEREGEGGVFFPTLAAEPRSGRLYLAWQAAADARRYRVEVATRLPEDGRWKQLGSVLGDRIEDGRSPAWGSAPPGEGTPLAFVSVLGRGASELYRLSLRGESPGGLTKLSAAPLREGAELARYAQAQIAFPAVADGLIVWGHAVPNACGTGPLFWTWGGRPSAPPQELFGEFASYPHLAVDPNDPEVFHLVWTDRVGEELRAFEVRYARLRLRTP